VSPGGTAASNSPATDHSRVALVRAKKEELIFTIGPPMQTSGSSSSPSTTSADARLSPGYIGGPIVKDKLFFFGSYQAQRVSDQLLASSTAAVPPGLTDTNRDAAG